MSRPRRAARLVSGRIERTRKGDFRLRLPAAERDALRSMPDQLRTLLAESPDDPALVRLFPTAYQDDPEREEEYRELMRDELLEQHLSSLRDHGGDRGRRPPHRGAGGRLALGASTTSGWCSAPAWT